MTIINKKIEKNENFIYINQNILYVVNYIY